MHLRVFALLGAIFAILRPHYALAEHISTFWQLEPIDSVMVNSVSFNTPALSQRLLPIGLVALTEPANIGDRTFGSGSLFFKVFNDDGKVGYCAVPKKRPIILEPFRIPIADQQPCLVDSKKDGHFDSVFYAFEQSGGLPTYHGSINNARSLPFTVGYRFIDVHSFPNKLVIFLIFRKGMLGATGINLGFSPRILTTYKPVNAIKDHDGSIYFNILNYKIKAGSITGDNIDVTIGIYKDIYLCSNMRASISWMHLPLNGTIN